MTPIDVLTYFRTTKNFEKATGFSHASLIRWRQINEIPMDAQVKLEILTDGILKSDKIDTQIFRRYLIEKLQDKE